MYDYLSCGLPVIYDMGIEGYDPVSAHDVGLSVNGASIDDLANVMYEMSRLPLTRHNQMALNANRAFSEHYNLQVNGHKLLKLLNDVCPAAR